MLLSSPACLFLRDSYCWLTIFATHCRSQGIIMIINRWQPLMDRYGIVRIAEPAKEGRSYSFSQGNPGTGVLPIGLKST